MIPWIRAGALQGRAKPVRSLFQSLRNHSCLKIGLDMQPLTSMFLRKCEELVSQRRLIWLRVSFRVSKWPVKPAPRSLWKILVFDLYFGQMGQCFWKNPPAPFHFKRRPIRDSPFALFPCIHWTFSPLDDLSIGKRDAGMTTTWTSKLRCSPLVQGCPVSFFPVFF
jgi:hypothetical protein